MTQWKIQPEDWKEDYKEFDEATEKFYKYIILKQRNWICDVTPLQDELGFVPAYPLRRGLEESIEWYRKEGWL